MQSQYFFKGFANNLLFFLNQNKNNVCRTRIVTGNGNL